MTCHTCKLHSHKNALILSVQFATFLTNVYTCLITEKYRPFLPPQELPSGCWESIPTLPEQCSCFSDFYNHGLVLEFCRNCILQCVFFVSGFFCSTLVPRDSPMLSRVSVVLIYLH